METSLHQQLKRLYAADADSNEVTVDGYRIDAIAEGRLIEIQCASLGAIRDKIRVLCESHDVTVVKPVVARKRIVKRKTRDGAIVSSRLSPKRQLVPGVFEDLVHFTRAFPHPRLVVEVVEVEVDEHRIPRTRRRWRQPGHSVVDRELVAVLSRQRFEQPRDFAALLPDLPEPFSTGDVATASGLPRWLVQKAAYFLRETGAWTIVGKQGNSLLYATAPQRADRAA